MTTAWFSPIPGIEDVPHYVDTRRPEEYRDRRVFVIGKRNSAFEIADVLVSPTAPTTAFPIGEKVDDPLAMYLNDIASIPTNLAGTAAMSVPAGLADDGLPVGLQIMAPALGEAVMYRVGAAYEAARNAEDGGPLIDRIPSLPGVPA